MEFHVTYPDQSEGMIQFDDLLSGNKYTVVYFYPKDNTPGCTIQANQYAEFYQDFLSHDAQVVGVSKDSHQSHCGFIDKHGIPFPLISDTELVLHQDKRFATRGEKSMFGKKYMGTIRSSFILDQNGNVVKEWKNVKAKGNAEEVLSYITGL